MRQVGVVDRTEGDFGRSQSRQGRSRSCWDFQVVQTVQGPRPRLSARKLKGLVIAAALRLPDLVPWTAHPWVLRRRGNASNHTAGSGEGRGRRTCPGSVHRTGAGRC